MRWGASPPAGLLARAHAGVLRRARRVGGRRLGHVVVDLAARVLGEEVGDLLGVLAHDDVLRHRAGGEAAVGDRVEHLVLLDLALVEVRAVDVLAVVRVRGRAVRPRGVDRVAARAVLLEEHRALVVRVVLGELDALLAARGQHDRRAGDQRQRCEAGAAGTRHAAAQHTEPGTTPVPPARHAARHMTTVHIVLGVAGVAAQPAPRPYGGGGRG